MSLGMEVSLGPGDFVRWGPRSLSPKRGRSPSPIFGPFLLWPNGWMHQDTTWYGCRPQPRGLLDRDPVPSPKRERSPQILGPCLLWQNGRMDQDGTWHGGGPWSRPRCIRRVPSFRERGIAALPLFGACLLWLRSPISATAELLFILVQCPFLKHVHTVSTYFAVALCIM